MLSFFFPLAAVAVALHPLRWREEACECVRVRHSKETRSLTTWPFGFCPLFFLYLFFFSTIMVSVPCILFLSLFVLVVGTRMCIVSFFPSFCCPICGRCVGRARSNCEMVR